MRTFVPKLVVPHCGSKSAAFIHFQLAALCRVAATLCILCGNSSGQIHGTISGPYRDPAGVHYYETKWTGLTMGRSYTLELSTNAVEWLQVNTTLYDCMTNAPMVLDCPVLAGPGPRLIRLVDPN